MGACLIGQNSRDPLERKRKSRMKQEYDLSYAKTEDEQKMIKHRERIIKKRKQQNKPRQTMDEDELKKILSDIFDQYDLDGDGTIDLNEFLLLLSQVSLRKYGKVETGLNTDDVKRVLAKSDQDGNVLIDKKEFYDMYKKL